MSRFTIKYDNNKCLYVRVYTPFVKGVVGQDIFLPLRQRLGLLFGRGIALTFIEDKLGKGGTEK